MNESYFNNRYIRQSTFPPIGEKGQGMLAKSRVALIGCGGLGSSIASNLVRSGVGFLRIVDNDVLEISNIHRQCLYNEEDLKRNIPKVFIAKEKLNLINSTVNIEAINQRANDENMEIITEEIDIVLDGTDNFQTRFLINKACIKKLIPWIFGSAAGSNGMVFNIIPKKTPCFACLFSEAPSTEFAETSVNAGILNTIVNTIAAIQSTEAIKYLTGNENTLLKGLLFIDLWDLSFVTTNIKKPVDFRCPVCE